MAEYLETKTHDVLRKDLHNIQKGLIEAKMGLGGLTKEGKAQFPATRRIDAALWLVNQALISVAGVLRKVPDELGMSDEMRAKQGDQS